MEEEPAERVTTHHRSVGKEGLQRRGCDGVGVGGLLRGSIMSMPILLNKIFAYLDFFNRDLDT